MTPLEFTPEEKRLSKIQIVEQGIDPDNFDDSRLPSDTHIVSYTIGDETIHDAVRAYTMVDIHDPYFDKLAGTGSILEIRSGLGRIRPNLYGSIKYEEQADEWSLCVS